ERFGGLWRSLHGEGNQMRQGALAVIARRDFVVLQIQTERLEQFAVFERLAKLSLLRRRFLSRNRVGRLRDGLLFFPPSFFVGSVFVGVVGDAFKSFFERFVHVE